jgi:hypothetical protein
MTNKFYLRNTFMLIVSIILSSQLLTSAPASAARNNYIDITVPTSVKLTGECVTFSVNYKIMPNFRESPAAIFITISKSGSFSAFSENYEYFAYHELFYNVDMSDFTWVNQNVDFIDKINLEFCPEDGYSESGQGIVGLTTPGKYYVVVLAKINTYGEAPTPYGSSRLDINFLATPITITKNSTITCKKGNVTKKVSSSNPKCPSGYKKVG